MGRIAIRDSVEHEHEHEREHEHEYEYEYEQIGAPKSPPEP